MPDWAREYFERGYAQRWGLPPASEQTRLELGGLWDLLHLTSNSPVVDIGCGHGRYSLALAQRGLEVVGVDFASTLLDHAQRLAAALSIEAYWVRGDMRQLPLRSSYFHAAILLDAFGFFETEEENEVALAEAARVLVPRGRIALKVVNAEPILAAFRGTDHEERDGTVVALSRTLTLEPTRLTEKITVSGSRGRGRYERRQRLYRAEELCAALERAGLSVVSLCASAFGAVFDPAASATMWIIGRR